MEPFQVAPADDPAGRRAWFHGPRGGAAGLPPMAFVRAAENRSARDAVEVRDAPEAGAVNWVPIGPFAVRGGQASGHPVVSGRVEGLAVGPGGNRVYLGAADGGVWFSPDAGEHWEPLDEFITSNPNATGRANSLAVGALAVHFGDERGSDRIYVGTGEHVGGFRGLFGIGVRVSTDGGATWTLEAAPQFAGKAFLRLAIDPDEPEVVLAATNVGLFRRAEAGARWDQVISANFLKIVNGELDDNNNGVVSDVLIAGTGLAKNYYVAFLDNGVYRNTPLDDPNRWTGVPSAGGGPTKGDGRIVLAASETSPDVVYAFGGKLTRLFRLTDGRFEVVDGIPQNVFGVELKKRRSDYNIILAVEPSAADTVYLGGSAVRDQVSGDPLGADWTLALFKGTVTKVGDKWTFPFQADNNSTETGKVRESTDATFVGGGIHPDGQSFAFGRKADNSGLDSAIVWVGCDGGAFRSTSSGTLGSFNSVNTGLSTVQLTYLSNHPTLDAVVLAGCQDNGTIRRGGGAVWDEPKRGDGGGVAIDPNNPHRMMRQYVHADISRTMSGGATDWDELTFPPSSSIAPAHVAALDAEKKGSAFYSPIVTTPAGVVDTLVAKGTNRIWMSPNWGSDWVTLPTGKNPYASGTSNLVQDSLGAAIIGLAFPAADLIFAATNTAVFRFVKAAEKWGPSPADAKLPTIPGVDQARPITSISSGGGSTLYATVGGVGVEHCWYHDGTSWFATGLITTADVPASTVVVDGTSPPIVYAGTDVGVYQTTRTDTGPTLHSGWGSFSRGLPEAAVLDLSFQTSGRLLRAATHGRGAYEFAVDAATAPHPELYLRMNSGDDGRRLPGSDVASHPELPGTQLTPTDSPDIRIRRGIVAVPPPAFPGRLLRLSRPKRMTGDDVKAWQQGVADRGFVLAADGVFGRESDLICRRFQARLGLAVDGIVGPITWPATFTYPALTDATSALAVELATVDPLDPASGASLVDATGNNQIFVEVHSRSVHSLDAEDVIVVLLLAEASPSVPALPAGFAERVRNRDTTPWLAGSGWVFASPGAPYALLPGPVRAAAPQVAEYLVDFSTVGFASTSLVALALVSTTSPADQLTATETAITPLIRSHRHAAAKLLKLVP